MKELLATALQAAKSARELILSYYNCDFDIEIKADQTPVTVADRGAERIIREIINSAYPEHGIFGEEYGAESKDTEYLWLVDPIDGTKSFVKRYGMFSTQIALMHKGELILGVSCAPAMNELVWATRGGGAFSADGRLHISDVVDISKASISTGNIQSLAASKNWAALGRILAETNRTRGYGDFYHYHRLAAGQLDAVIESDVNILDIAALYVIVTEAGGVFTDLEGQAPGLDTHSVLAATPGLHGVLSAELQRA
ncbi:MAG: inositol-phosphate phosphatase [Gammaproteobacteria bacterium]|nr:inositol-phosphate phosphatase [Gammaproteobacteria bacterium]